MAAAGLFSAIFEVRAADATSLVFKNPTDVISQASSPSVAGWLLLRGAIAFRRAGQRSPANDWLNHAMRLNVEDRVFLAELLGEAGEALFRSNRPPTDALKILLQATSTWRTVCDEATLALEQPSSKLAAQFGLSLLPLFEAANVKPFATKNTVKGEINDVQVIREWLEQRAAVGRAETAGSLFRLISSERVDIDARQLWDAEWQWIERTFRSPQSADAAITAQVRHAIYELLLAKGEIELGAGEFQSSADAFGQAAALYEGQATDYDDLNVLLRAKFNQANSLLDLGRYNDAIDIYNLCEDGFSSIGDDGAAHRVAHAKLFAMTRAADRDVPEVAVRELIINGERALSDARNRADRKQVLQPQYQLYLTALGRSKSLNVERAEDYLRIVRAIREDQALASLELAPRNASLDLEKNVGSPLRVLDAYLKRLPRAMVLVIESGVDVLTLLSLSSGNETLEDRITLKEGSKELLHQMEALIQQQLIDLNRIAEQEPITSDFSTSIERIARAVWLTMPPEIRSALCASDTIFYLPGSGDLSLFPLELLRADDGWLGVTHSIVRLSSMRTLFELLSANRMPSKLGEQALVVRAQDIEELTSADAEIDSVRSALGALELSVEVQREPRVRTIRAALDAGMRALHYCGHGFAGRQGEYLPLGPNEELGAHDFSGLAGSGSPFVYLSTCEVGRARRTLSGSGAGLSLRLLEKGAPAVVAWLHQVPDLVAREMATSFYEAAATRPVGAAMMQTRSLAAAFPPSSWGAFVLFGDPNFELRASGLPAKQTRVMTRRWDSWVARHLAIRSSRSRQRALDEVEIARAEPNVESNYFDNLLDWLAESFSATEPDVKEERLKLCQLVAATDAVAGATLRMLLAMETLHGSYFGKRKPDLILDDGGEAVIGLYCAYAIHDTLAWSAFVIESAQGRGIHHDPVTLARMLDEAIGALKGWQLEEPEAADMLSDARSLRVSLSDS
jgi:CHAT domain-containing protein